MKTAEEILADKGGSLICVGPDATVLEAVKVMAEHRIGAVLVKEGDVFVGIYTERDLLKNTAATSFDPSQASMRDHMTCKLQFVQHDTPIYKLQDLMLGKRIRHLLVVKAGKYIGMLSAGDVMKAHMNDMSEELKSVSWEYYENWRFKKK